LISRIASNEGALEFENCLHNELELVNFGFFFNGNDFIVFDDLCYDLMQLQEGVGKLGFNLWDIHLFAVLLVNQCSYSFLVSS
jgi:hypothetical protein